MLSVISSSLPYKIPMFTMKTSIRTMGSYFEDIIMISKDKGEVILKVGAVGDHLLYSALNLLMGDGSFMQNVTK